MDQKNETMIFLDGIINKEAEFYDNDFKKIFVGGFSQGGFLSLHIAITFPEVLGGVVVCSGSFFT